jgi:hypothetical protein
MTSVVKDLIEIKGRVALTYGLEGVVVIFEVETAVEAPATGDVFVIERADGWLYRGRAKDARAVGEKLAGFFIDGLTREDVPLGTLVRWRNGLWPEASTLKDTAVTP